MAIVDLREFEEEFVVHFGTERTRINAYTLASTLVAIADATREANQIVNPGYSVEVVVEAISPGSFRAKFKAVYTGAGNLFSNDNLKTIALNVVASYIFVNTLAPDTEVSVRVDDSQVIIEQGDKTIIVSKETHDAMKNVEKSQKFRQDIGKAFSAVEKDQEIHSIGIARSLDDEKSPLEIPRQNFGLLSQEAILESDKRELIEAADLEILRAVLERSKRKWEFVWRGVKISAPVLDEKFFDDFFAHRITIAPGDALRVQLKIYQRRNEDTGIYTNERYEVTRVDEHVPRMTQIENPQGYV